MCQLRHAERSPGHGPLECSREVLPNTARPQSGITFGDVQLAVELVELIDRSNHNPSARAVTAVPTVV